MLLKAEKGLCVPDDSSSTFDTSSMESPIKLFVTFILHRNFIQCTLHLMSFLRYHHTVNEQALRFLVTIHNSNGDEVQWWRRALSFSSLIYT